MLPEAHIVPPLVNSDNEAIELKSNYTNYKLNLLNNNIVQYKRNFQKINVEGIFIYFKNVNKIYEFSLVKTVEERYAILLRYLNLSIQMFVLLKLIKRKSKKFYLPKHIKLMLLKKKKSCRIVKTKNIPENKRNLMK